MPYTVDLQCTIPYPMPYLRAVAKAANMAMTHESVSNGAACTILLTDDDYIRQLNIQYRGEDHATDVLSFPGGDPIPGSEDLLEYLGDIAISVDMAKSQAASKGHETTAELQLLAVHGVLHLLGYDHYDEAERAAMWAVQTAILERLGLSGIQPTEDEYDD